MRVPDEIRRRLRLDLWLLADHLDWSRLSWSEKSRYYEAWTREPQVGGLLSNYIDERRVRVYIKDTIMKGYIRSRTSDAQIVMKVLGVEPSGCQVVEDYERPHGRRFLDGRIIAWSKARDWKAVLMAMHERAYFAENGCPFGAVLFSAVGKFDDDSVRGMVTDAASRLQVQNLIWLK